MHHCRSSVIHLSCIVHHLDSYPTSFQRLLRPFINQILPEATVGRRTEVCSDLLTLCKTLKKTVSRTKLLEIVKLGTCIRHCGSLSNLLNEILGCPLSPFYKNWSLPFCACIWENYWKVSFVFFFQTVLLSDVTYLVQIETKVMEMYPCQGLLMDDIVPLF